MEAKTRLILAANLRALMGARPKLATFPQIVEAGGPSNGTLDRIRRHESGCSVDQLDLLAKVFELEPWQLLIPNLQPNNAPIILGAGGEAERVLWHKIDQLANEVKELRDAGATRPGELVEEHERGERISDATARKAPTPARRGAK